MLKLLNVRDGFAANSSSSHSLLIVKNGVDVTPNEEYSDFGWGYFTLTDPEAKLNYLWAQLHPALVGSIGAHNAEVVLSKLGVRTTRRDAYIDHQSKWPVIRSFDGNTINLEFMTALVDVVQRPDTVILGGNDNGQDHALADGSELMLQVLGNNAGRYDPYAKVWSVFSRETGMKLRFSFENGPTPERGGVPELVDVKITDWCDFGCKACYQGSTARGKHADWRYLEGVAEALGDNQVWEAAIGGGEATGHPEFSNFVDALVDRHVTANLTTRNLGWLAENVETASKLGAVAFSTETADLVGGFAEVELPGVQRTVQVIDGLVEADEFRRICEASWENNIRVTLLGYKTTGRGSRMANQLVDSGWIKAYSEDWFKRWRFSIDTAAARRYRSQIQSMGVSDRSYHTEEGAWSCYIDAVSQRIGASSYSPVDRSLDLAHPGELVGRFQALEVEDLVSSAVQISDNGRTRSRF